MGRKERLTAACAASAGTGKGPPGRAQPRTRAVSRPIDLLPGVGGARVGRCPWQVRQGRDKDKKIRKSEKEPNLRAKLTIEQITARLSEARENEGSRKALHLDTGTIRNTSQKNVLRENRSELRFPRQG